MPIATPSPKEASVSRLRRILPKPQSCTSDPASPGIVAHSPSHYSLPEDQSYLAEGATELPPGGQEEHQGFYISTHRSPVHDLNLRVTSPEPPRAYDLRDSTRRQSSQGNDCSLWFFSIVSGIHFSWYLIVLSDAKDS